MDGGDSMAQALGSEIPGTAPMSQTLAGQSWPASPTPSPMETKSAVLERRDAAGLDDVRNYWNARPCNIRHSVAEVGSEEYFNQVEARKYMVEPHIPGFAEFDKWKGKKVLEVGCGLGTDATNFARAGADYTGVELSQSSMELAKKRFEVFGLKGRFFLGNGEELSRVIPEGETFDLIYSFGVIHHTPDPAQVIREIRKLMHPGSELRVMLYAKTSWKHIMIEAGFDQPEAQYGCPIAYTYTHDEVRDLFEGLDVFSIEQDHIFPYVVEKYVKYEYEKLPWIEAMPADVFRVMEQKLGWHTLIKARLKA